jgi:ribosomal protein L11 methyltransferase
MSENIQKWSEISILTTNEAVEAITNILDEAGTSGMVIEDAADLTAAREFKYGAIYELDPANFPEEGVRVKTYLPESKNAAEIAENLKNKIERLKDFQIDIGKNKIVVTEIHEEDWANNWKQYFKPIKVSEKLTIKPTWEDYTPVSHDELVIEMDPGMAFGTGTHPTTILSLRALEKYLNKEDIVLDVGSGSGVLSIASALLGAKQVYAYDLDNVAVKSTQINVEMNHLEGKVIAEQNDLLQNVDKHADVIVSNILAEIIVQFIEDAWNNLRPGGLFIISGIILDKKQLVIDELKKNEFEVIAEDVLKDWISIIAKKGEKVSK